MGAPALQRSRAAWTLARRQQGLLTWSQLIGLGFSAHAIKHRIRKGRLRRVHPTVYAVGWGELSTERTWMAAVLACGTDALLSHSSAAALWDIGRIAAQPEITVPAHRHPHPAGVRVHRTMTLQPEDLCVHHGIPVTSPIRTLIDLATRLSLPSLEAAINAADKHDLVDPDALRAAIERRPGQRGVPHLRRVLDMRAFVLTDSELERMMLPLIRRAGLPLPQTGVMLNGFKVDFFWPEIGLVVETDGLRYHRTQAQQARDGVRDHSHVEAGLLPLRFTYAQVAHDPDAVVRTLSAAAERVRAA